MDVLIVLGVGATFKALALSWISSKKRKQYVGKISKIYVYPLKSAKHLPNVTNASLTKHGLMINGVTDR